jgi:hypothetical protein
VPEGLRPCSIRRTGRAWQPRWHPSTRRWPTVAHQAGFGLLSGGRRPSVQPGPEAVLARRGGPARVQVLPGRAAPPAPPGLWMLTLSRVLQAGPTVIRLAAPPGPDAPARAAAAAPMAHAAARLERLALTRTLRVEGIGPPGLPGTAPPAVTGPRGDAGRPGPQGVPGVPGPAPGHSTPLVLRSSPPPAAPAGRPEPSPTTTADARPDVRPADVPVPAPPPLPSIDEITTQVIRRIERRATAQRERLARPPGG